MCSVVRCMYINECFLNELYPLSLVYNAHLCLLLTFLVWSLFCLIWVWLRLLSFGRHLLRVSFCSPLLRTEMSLLESACSWVLCFNPSRHSLSSAWWIQSIYIQRVCVCVFAMLCGMQDLSFPTRHQTHAPCNGRTVLTTGPPGKFPFSVIIDVWGLGIAIYLLFFGCSVVPLFLFLCIPVQGNGSLLWCFSQFSLFLCFGSLL